MYLHLRAYFRAKSGSLAFAYNSYVIFILVTFANLLIFVVVLRLSYVLGPPFEFGGLITLPSSLPLTATAAAAPRGGMSSACVGLEGQLI